MVFCAKEHPSLENAKLQARRSRRSMAPLWVVTSAAPAIRRHLLISTAAVVMAAGFWDCGGRSLEDLDWEKSLTLAHSHRSIF
eukprot:COSAG01_NODE_9400_length_2455_cov_8.225382_4_plen_83_part_00